MENGRNEQTIMSVSAQTENRSESGWRTFGRVFAKLLLLIFETVLLLCIVLYGVMYILAKGPSPAASEKFVTSVRETSAIGFLADLFFTPEEIAEIESVKEAEDFAPTDTSLITIGASDTAANTAGQDTAAPKPDAWGLVDEDGDGIIIDPVKGSGYAGYMMVVLDPSRVIIASRPQDFGVRGHTVAEFVDLFGAVAGINGGGFEDPNGMGNGSIPDSIVVYDGTVYYSGCAGGIVGIDDNNILHVATKMSKDEIVSSDIRYALCYGPVLVSNGEPADPDSLAKSLNPRTAIGQRSDGAILLLVIDGRQASSIGATYQDEVDIMLKYGAVNALNLDGGSSSVMWFGGDYINKTASVIGIRPVPTCVLVLGEGTGE